MKELLLVEKSTFDIKKSANDSYILEGVFTELGNENRNGRIYTEAGFLPHLEELSKIVDKGKCVGELDHPKVFETSLRNVSHVIEKIWYDKDEHKVYGRIKLLDTDAGRQAKALVDGGIPLHISSRAAGTVAENKTVKIHKLFTYDLVADPGFENAVLNTVNESYGFSNDENSNFYIFDVNESKTPVVKTSTDGLVTEEDLNKFTEFTKYSINSIKEEINSLKSVQDALSIQSSEIAETINEDLIQESIDNIMEKLAAFEAWSMHVVEEFEKNSITEYLEKLTSIEEKIAAFEEWSNEATTAITSIENWSEHVTETVTAIEAWSEHATETVSSIESWSEHVTETVSSIEEWSNEATNTITSLQESTINNPEEKINESVNAKSDAYITELNTKINSIIENAKKQKAEAELELIKESKKVPTNLELPVWLSMIPEKYKEMWESLAQIKRSSIEKRANICEFSTEKSIKEFWDSTFAGQSIEMIKESAKTTEINSVNEESVADAKRKKIIEDYNRNFNNI